MEVSRRDLLKLAAIAAGAGLAPRALHAAPSAPDRLLEMEPLGNVTLLHLTDSHATLRPVYFREPDTLIGIGDERGKPPYLTGSAFLRFYGLAPDTAEAYAYTSVDFPTLAARYGTMGGYAHLATLVKGIRSARAGAHPAARRRRHPAGLGHRAVEPRRGHGARHQPARRGGLHRALGVQLRHRPRARAAWETARERDN